MLTLQLTATVHYSNSNERVSGVIVIRAMLKKVIMVNAEVYAYLQYVYVEKSMGRKNCRYWRTCCGVLQTADLRGTSQIWVQVRGKNPCIAIRELSKNLQIS